MGGVYKQYLVPDFFAHIQTQLFPLLSYSCITNTVEEGCMLERIERICPCEDGEAETIEYVLLYNFDRKVYKSSIFQVFLVSSMSCTLYIQNFRVLGKSNLHVPYSYLWYQFMYFFKKTSAQSILPQCG